jgi:hypothetical protein
LCINRLTIVVKKYTEIRDIFSNTVMVSEPGRFWDCFLLY